MKVVDLLAFVFPHKKSRILSVHSPFVDYYNVIVKKKRRTWTRTKVYLNSASEMDNFFLFRIRKKKTVVEQCSNSNGERHSLDCHRQVNYSRAEGGDGLAYWVGEAQPRRTHTHIHNGRLVIKFSVNHYGSLTLPICEKNFFFSASIRPNSELALILS